MWEMEKREKTKSPKISLPIKKTQQQQGAEGKMGDNTYFISLTGFHQ